MNLEKQYKMNFRKIGCAVIMLTLALSAAAQSESGKKFEYRIKAGFNIMAIKEGRSSQRAVGAVVAARNGLENA